MSIFEVHWYFYYCLVFLNPSSGNNYIGSLRFKELAHILLIHVGKRYGNETKRKPNFFNYNY